MVLDKYTFKAAADLDRNSRFLEPGQSFQIWVKIDKNLGSFYSETGQNFV